SRLVAAVLSGHAALPDEAARRRSAAADDARRADFGLRPRDTHYLGEMQWNYNRQIAGLAGCLDDALERRLRLAEAIYNDAGDQRRGFPGGPDTYRRREYHVDWAAGTFTTSWADRKAEVSAPLAAATT
ncbi:unnamed protein product, partial [Phaeothamnion confervicola]